MKSLLSVLAGSVALASCLYPGDHPKSTTFQSFGYRGHNSAIAASDGCDPHGLSGGPFYQEGFAAGYSYLVRIATNTPEAPTLRSSAEDVARVTPGSRAKLRVLESQYHVDAPLIVNTWSFQVEALSEGDAELIVERGGEDIDTFDFNVREVDHWDLDATAVSLSRVLSADRERRQLQAFDELGRTIAHNVDAHWTTGSVEIVGFGYGSASADIACTTLIPGQRDGQTTVDVTSPVGSWSIDVTVTE
jgi:hypothetical protein